MASLIPTNFPIPPESALANYDWQDIASGIGYKTFYLCTQYNTTDDTTYFLADRVDQSEDDFVEVGSAGRDFDTSVFNYTRTIKGTAIVILGFNASESRALTARLIKVSEAAAETEIAAARTSSSSSAEDYKRVHLSVAETTINPGEKLRLEVTESGQAYLGTSPTETTVTTPAASLTKSQSRLIIPFKVEL